MGNFKDSFETFKQSFVSVFLICMTVPLMAAEHVCEYTRGKLFHFSNAVTKTYPYRLRISSDIDMKELW